MKSLLLILVSALICFSIPVVTGAAEDQVVKVVEMAGKAIVNIRTEEFAKSNEDEQKSSPFKKYFKTDEDSEELVENFGSGVVLDPTGIIVTNEHLISKAITIRVKFVGGKEFDAYVLASDPEFDIALVKIISGANQKFPYLTLGKKKTPLIGEKAIVIGNPYGLSSSVSVGVISALGRNLRVDNNKVYANLIQTDAAINPGNSGGVLLDVQGNPIGIVTAIYGEGKGIGFAIPMEDVTNVLAEFLDSSPRRPILGFFIEKTRDERGPFLLVTKVIPRSPSTKYGIQPGDRITELNKKTIREGTKLQSVIRGLRDDETIQVRLVRGNKKLTINADITELQNYTPSPVDELLCGMKTSDIKGYPKLKYRLRDKEGVVITKILGGGIAEKSGLKAGDVVVKINNNVVKDHKSFDSFMIEGLKRNYILYQVKRDENLFFLPIKLDTLL